MRAWCLRSIRPPVKLLPIMEMERVTEFPISQLDLRPRKRQRLGWDVAPAPTKAQVGLFYAQEIGNVTSFAPLGAPTDHISSSILKRVARDVSPPWRQVDKDGHYVFAVGDNLTTRYKIHGKMGEGMFGQVLECWDKERKEMVAIKIREDVWAMLGSVQIFEATRRSWAEAILLCFQHYIVMLGTTVLILILTGGSNMEEELKQSDVHFMKVDQSTLFYLFWYFFIQFLIHVRFQSMVCFRN